MSKILIIDDELINRKMATFVLEKNGFSVIQAESGVAGLSAIRSEHPDLVLLDIEMAGMNGFEVLEEIRKDAAIADTKVIFYVGSVDVDIESKMTELGVLDIVKKPVVADVFVASVSKYL